MQSDPAVHIVIDPRVELFSIIFRLAESPFYIDPGFAPYDEAIAAHFAPHREHRAVTVARSLPKPWGRSGPSALSLAVLATDAPNLRLKHPHRPFAAGLERWSWRKGEAEAFLAAARAFVRDADFDAFLVEQQPFYAQVTLGLERCLRRWAHFEWLDWFFGPTPGRRLHVIAAPLIGDRNYGAQCLSRAQADFYAIIAPSQADVPERVVFRRSQAQIVMHEFSHSYVNPMVARHRPEFRAPGGEALRVGEQHYGCDGLPPVGYRDLRVAHPRRGGPLPTGVRRNASRCPRGRERAPVGLCLDWCPGRSPWRV